MRTVVKAWWILLLVALLSACVDIRGEADLHADGTSKGDVTVEVNKQMMRMGGVKSVDEMIQKMKEDPDTPPGITWTGSETSQTYIITSKGDFPAEEMPWKTSRQGDIQTITVSNDTATPGGSIDLTLHVEGYINPTIGSHTRRIDDNTVRISGKTDEKWSDSVTVDLSRKPMESSDNKLVPLLIVGGLLLLVSLVIIGVILTVRRQRARAAAPSQPLPPSAGSET